MKLILYVALAFCLACIARPVMAQGNYVATELDREDNFAPLFTEDMNGDGRDDIVVPYHDRLTGRELHIHEQLADGTFAAEPQRIEIKTEIIAVGFAELRDDPGMELVLFAGSGVFSLSTRQESYVGNLKPLVQWELIATVPDLERLRFTSLPDVNGDGKADLLLPGANEWGLFYGADNETFIPAARFATNNDDLGTRQQRNRSTELDTRMDISSEEGVVVRLNAATPSPYAGFLQSWEDEPRSDSLLRSDIWLPNANFNEMDTVPGLDLTYLNTDDEGLAWLHIHNQRVGGAFVTGATAADWSGSVDDSGELRFMDFNGDGLVDLLRLSGDGDEWTAYFYLNLDGKFDLETPQQIMRFSGYDLRLEVVRLSSTPSTPTMSTQDAPVLSINYFTIPVVEAIRSATLNRVQLLYGSDAVEPGQVFNRQPAARQEESFSADNVRGLTERATLRYDVDGDGRNDALYITGNGTLAARRVEDDLTIADEPFWEYVSSRTVVGYEVMHLNDDALPDLLLLHGTVTTMLVATP
ncbi:MAG: hypothetical protein ACR2PR_04180 [Pseudohongiellaceae bacterium]